MKIYGIYENNKTETCVFVGTAKEISKEFGLKMDSIHKAIYRGSKIHGNRKKLYILKIISNYLYDEEVD